MTRSERMSGTKKGGFQRVFNEIDILDVLSNEKNELRTSTILKRLAERESNYEGRTHRGLAITLNKMAEKHIVQKIKKEDEIADYWIITDAGIKKREEEQEN